MATYNGEKYLQDQLNSFLDQSVQPYELVVCDDKSNDETLNILNEFKELAPFPVNIHKNEERLGHGRNFLKAAMLCTGDWIMYSDQDDYWLPNKIQVLVDAVNTHTDAISLVHVAQHVNEDLSYSKIKLWPRISKKQIMPALSSPCMSFIRNSGHAIMIDAEIFRKMFNKLCQSRSINDVCAKVAHDIWSNLVANTFGDVIYIPDVLVLHRRHSDSQSGSGMDGEIGSSVRAALSTGKDLYSYLSMITHGYSELLRDNYSYGDDQYEQAKKSTLYYENVGKLLKKRSIISSDNFLNRLGAFIRIIINRGYFSHPLGYGLGYKAFFKDSFLTIFLSLPGVSAK